MFGQCDSDARFEKFSESEKNFYGFFVQGGFFFLWVFCVGFFFSPRDFLIGFLHMV